jgi:hypothetical protein
VARLGRSVTTADLSFPPIPNVGHPLLVVRTICKTDRAKASGFVKASGALICLEAPSEILVLGRDDKIGSREHYGHDLYSPKG